MPGLPEAVTYDEYEELRDSGLPPSSIHVARPYTLRWRYSQPTRECFAHDLLSLIHEIKHLGRYSLVGARVRDFDRVKKVDLGISNSGIVFHLSPLPEDLDSIPYQSEIGYFVGEAGSSNSNEISDRKSEEVEVDEWLGSLALSR